MLLPALSLQLTPQGAENQENQALCTAHAARALGNSRHSLEMESLFTRLCLEAKNYPHSFCCWLSPW